jgi:Zn-dependent M28 family amino/carboxypeptidase
VLPVRAADFGQATKVNPTVRTLVNGVTQAELEQSVREISGEVATVVGGATTTLLTRSAKDPMVAVAEQYFFERLRGYGLNPTYQSYPGTGVVPPGRNVIAEIYGATKPTEIVIIAAHLDDRPRSGRAYGADDDASGCAALLYIAKNFMGKSFDRTIRFVFFNAEEDAPWSGSGKNFGSGYYAAGLRAAGENVVAMVAADSLAWNLSNNTTTYMVTRKPKQDPGGGDLAIATLWQQAVGVYGIGIKALPQRTSDNLDDHGSFWVNGYPAVMLIEDDITQVNPNWEQTTDRISTPGWQWDYYLRNVQSLVAAAAHLAGIR